MTITEFRQQYPQYNDMDNVTLTAALHSAHYSDIDKTEFDKAFIGSPTHDDLGTAAVTGKDSLDLQDLAPEIKPVVKMTMAEAKRLKLDSNTAPSKVFWSDGKGNAFVLDINTVQGIYGGSRAESIRQAQKDLKKGGDMESLLLGYPKREGVKDLKDVAVTKTGEVVDDLPTMKDHADNNNIAWAAQGEENETGQIAEKISAVIKGA